MTVKRDGTGEVSPPLWLLLTISGALGLTVAVVLLTTTSLQELDIFSISVLSTAVVNLAGGAWYNIQAGRAEQRTQRLLSESLGRYRGQGR